ncbi:MAG: hypothetical protein RL268_2749, partial [Pseudomonadota bacterium]
KSQEYDGVIGKDTLSVLHACLKQ